MTKKKRLLDKGQDEVAEAKAGTRARCILKKKMHGNG